ncbi:MAG: hypothetical protein WAY88_00185 [Minisyncoccia bacterium]
MFALVMLTISGIGAIMGGMYDVQHKRHGMAFGLGVPTLPIAALILSYSFFTNSTMVYVAHLSWISIALMALSMFVMFSGFKKAGIVWTENSTPPEKVPDGVIALGGYANRLLVIVFVLWQILATLEIIK